MQFRYKVIDDQLAVTRGTLEAVDLEAAKRMVYENRWQLIEIDEVKGFSTWLNKSIETGINYELISSFCSQLAMMVRSGANLVRGLEILEGQIGDKKLKQVITGLIAEVSAGNSLSAAMHQTRGNLPDLLVNLVAVGEQSGNLDVVLKSMADYYERESYIRKKVANAAVYPMILTFVLIGLIIFFINFILPEITGLMTDNNQDLPYLTQVVLQTVDIFTDFGLLILVGLMAIVIWLRRLFKIPKYRYYRDAFILKLPLLGKNLHNVVISRFSRTLLLFLHSAVPIVPTLNHLQTIVGNEVPRLALARTRERIIQGEPLAQAFSQEQFFDPLVIQMMSIGEETGRLEELMEEVANHYDKQVEIGIARMVALVEPAFTVLIGIFAGIMIISVALPIFNMANTIQ